MELCFGADRFADVFLLRFASYSCRPGQVQVFRQLSGFAREFTSFHPPPLTIPQKGKPPRNGCCPVFLVCVGFVTAACNIILRASL